MKPATRRTRGRGSGGAACGVIVLLLIGCTSPEAGRQRAGSPGADIGNRGRPVEMHEGAQMYYETECVMKGVECEGPSPVFGPGAALD